MFKNTFKLLINNFSTVWKILLYKIIVFICVMGLTIVVSLPIINTLINQGFFGFFQDNLSGMFLNFNLNNLVDIIILLVNKFYQILVEANLVPLFLSVGIVSITLYYFIDSLCYVSVTDDVRSFMSTNLKLGFMNCYVSNFGKSVKFGLVRLITLYIWDILIVAGAIGLYYLLAGLFIAPLASMLYILLMLSLKTTISAGWEVSMVVNNYGVFTAIKNGTKAIFRKFFVVLSNSLMLYILLMILNMFAVFFTFGVALVLILPMSILTVIIFKNVVYYECQGMRYYCDNQTIVMPKKLEEQDKFSRVKDII